MHDQIARQPALLLRELGEDRDVPQGIQGGAVMVDHCDHECVCREYANNLSISYDPCCVTCPNDTRKEAIRQGERDEIYKRLKEEVFVIVGHGREWMVVEWSDIDCLFAELKGGE
jgi:hypothetical protein